MFFLVRTVALLLWLCPPGPARQRHLAWPLPTPLPTLLPTLFPILPYVSGTLSPTNPLPFKGCFSPPVLVSRVGRAVLGAEDQVWPLGLLVRTVRPPRLLPGHREIRVIDTDYERYAILRLSVAWRGEDVHVLKYFSKLPGGRGAAVLAAPAARCWARSPSPLSSCCAAHSSQPGGRLRARPLEVPGADGRHRAVPGGPAR